MGTECGKGLLDALLIANVCVYAVEPGEAGILGGHMKTGVGHQRQQAHGLQGHCLAPGVGASHQHHQVF